MSLIRSIVLALAFLVPTTISVAHAGEGSTAESSPDQQPKKAKKTKKTKPKKGAEEKNPS